MICQNCGAHLPDGVAFCGGCGAAQRKEQPLPQNAAGAMPSTSQPSDCSQSAAAQQPYFGEAAAHLQQGQTETLSDTEALMSEYYRAANGYRETPTEQPIPEIEPQYYTSMPEEAAVKPIRKKKRLIPALCIAAGSLAVLAVTGIIVYNCNKAAVSHLLMGDAGYAHSLVMGSMSAAEETQFMDSAFSAMAASMSNASSSSDIINSISSINYGAIDSEDGAAQVIGSDSALEAAGKMFEYGIASLNNAAGVNGMSIKVSAETSLDSTLRDKLRNEIANAGLSPDMLDDLIDISNKMAITSAEACRGGAYELSAGLECGSEKWAEAQMRYEQDGTAAVIFPGVSDIGFKLQLPEHSYPSRSDEGIGQYDFSKLIKRISNATRSVFNEFDYEYSNGTASLNGLEFNGMIVKVIMPYDKLMKLCSTIIDIVAEDEELMNRLSEVTGQEASYLAASLRKTSSQLNGAAAVSDDDDMLSSYAHLMTTELTFYVENNNTVKGFAFDGNYSFMGKSKPLFSVKYLSQGFNREFSLSSGDTEAFAVHIKGESESSGRAEFVVNVPSYSWDESYSSMTVTDNLYSIYLDYSNVGDMQYFGTKGMKGDFVISLSDSIADLFGGYNSEIGDIVRGLKLHMSIAPNGKGALYKVGLEVPKYGKLMINMALDEVSGSVAPKPDGSYTLVDFDNADNEVLDKLSEDLYGLVERLRDSSSDFRSIDQIISALQNTSADTLDILD